MCRDEGVKAYQIGFYNDLTNDSGQNFHCCQRIVRIKAAKSEERAVKAAKRRFERAERIPHWRVHASYFQVIQPDLLSRAE